MPVIRDDHREHALNVVFWDLNDEETRVTQYVDRLSQLKRLADLIEREDVKLTIKSSSTQEPETRTPTAHELRELLRLFLLPSSNGYIGVDVFAESPMNTLRTPQREKYLKKPATKGDTSSNARMPKDIGGTPSEPINTSNKDSEMQIEARSAQPARSSKAEGQSKRRLLEVDDSSEEDAPVSNKRRKGAATKGEAGTGRHASMPPCGTKARPKYKAAAQKSRRSRPELGAIGVLDSASPASTSSLSVISTTPALSEDGHQSPAVGAKRVSGQAFPNGEIDEEGHLPAKRLKVKLRLGSQSRVAFGRQEMPTQDGSSDVPQIAMHDAEASRAAQTNSRSASAVLKEESATIEGGSDIAQLQNAQSVASSGGPVPAMASTTPGPLSPPVASPLISQPVPTTSHHPYGLRSTDDVEICVKHLVQMIRTTADDIVEALGLKNKHISFVPSPDRELELLYSRVLGKDGESWRVQAAQLELQGMKLQHVLSACIGAAVYEEVFLKKVPWTTSRDIMLKPEMQARLASFNELLSGLGAAGPCANMEYLMYQSGADMLRMHSGFDIGTVKPEAQRMASSFMLTITAQLRQCMEPKANVPADFSAEITSTLTDIFRRALLLKGDLDEAPQEVRYSWAPTGTPFSKVDMDEARGRRENEGVLASVFPGIARFWRDKWYDACKVHVFGH